MPPWHKKPCILPIANVGILSLLLPLETYTLLNKHLTSRQIEVYQSKKTNSSEQIQVDKTKQKILIP